MGSKAVSGRLQPMMNVHGLYTPRRQQTSGMEQGRRVSAATEGNSYRSGVSRSEQSRQVSRELVERAL